jgi:drug/metabolite transporter (DMT)-like permease
MRGSMTARGWLLFASMCVIWGVPYLLIKVAVEDVSPSMLVLARTAIAALLLLPIAAARNELRPLLPYWRPLLAFAAIEIALPWVLLGSAETRISSSLTALLIAAVPLIGTGIALVTVPRERLTLDRGLGLVLGLVGVASIVGVSVEGASARPIVEVFLVAVCYAVGPVILQRWLADLPPLGVIAASLLVTAVVYVPITAAAGPGAAPSPTAAAAIAALAVICTAIAFLLFFALIAEIGPVRATVITYVNPAVAAVLGVAVLDEDFTVGMAVGFVLVLAGSVLATRPGRVRRVTGQPVLEPAPERPLS